METEEKPLKLGPSVAEVYFSICSQSTVEEGLNLLGRYFRTTRENAQSKGRVRPIELGVPGLLCLARETSPKAGFAKGLVFSTSQMTRRFPVKLTLQENPRIDITFEKSTVLKFEMATFLKDFYAFELKDTGELEKKYFLTEAEIDSLKAASDSQHRRQEEEKQIGDLEEVPLEDPYSQHVAPSAPEHFQELPNNENFLNEMEVEREGEIVKGKIIEHGDQIEQIASTANTIPRFDDLSTDISDSRIEHEKENTRLKAEKSVDVKRITLLEEEDRNKTDRISALEKENERLRAGNSAARERMEEENNNKSERISVLEREIDTIKTENFVTQQKQTERIAHLESDNQSFQQTILTLQEQLNSLTSQFNQLQASSGESRALKRKKPKYNAEEVESDIQTPTPNKVSVENQSPNLEEEKQDENENKNMNQENLALPNSDSTIEPSENSEIPTQLSSDSNVNPVVFSALESLEHYEMEGLSAGVIDLFISLHCIPELKKLSDVKLYDSTKWNLSIEEIIC